MLKAIFRLENIENSILSFGRVTEDKKIKNESYEDMEIRIWKNKAHAREDGTVFIPAISLKHCLEGAAKWKSDKIEGRGKSTFGKRFLSGVRILKDLTLPFTVEELKPLRLFSSSDGKTNSTSGKVWKIFPYIEKWEAVGEALILDPLITKEIFESHLKTAGLFVGLSRWRPANGGYNGQFYVKDIKFENYEI